MDKTLKIQDEQYRQWITELSLRYQKSQIKAAVSVNSEMLETVRCLPFTGRWDGTFSK